MKNLALYGIIQRASPNTCYYVSKIIAHFNLTALLDHMTALLEYIDLIILDVMNIFQHEYYTSNQDLQNIMELESHLLSCTLAVTLQYDHNF